jgi:hypothetical protein
MSLFQVVLLFTNRCDERLSNLRHGVPLVKCKRTNRVSFRWVIHCSIFAENTTTVKRSTSKKWTKRCLSA